MIKKALVLGILLGGMWCGGYAQGTWTQKASLPGNNREGAVSFTIGNKGYIATGYGLGWLKDLWEYDPSSNSWTQKANYQGNGSHIV